VRDLFTPHCLISSASINTSQEELYLLQSWQHYILLPYFLFVFVFQTIFCFIAAHLLNLCLVWVPFQVTTAPWPSVYRYWFMLVWWNTAPSKQPISLILYYIKCWRGNTWVRWERTPLCSVLVLIAREFLWTLLCKWLEKWKDKN